MSTDCIREPSGTPVAQPHLQVLDRIPRHASSVESGEHFDSTLGRCGKIADDDFTRTDLISLLQLLLEKARSHKIN